MLRPLIKTNAKTKCRPRWMTVSLPGCRLKLTSVVGADFDASFIDWLFARYDAILNAGDPAAPAAAEPTSAPAAAPQSAEPAAPGAGSRMFASAVEGTKRKAEGEHERRRLPDGPLGAPSTAPTGPRMGGQGRNLADRLGPRGQQPMRGNGVNIRGRGGHMGPNQPYRPQQPQQGFGMGMGMGMPGMQGQQEMMMQMMAMQANMMQMAEQMQSMQQGQGQVQSRGQQVSFTQSSKLTSRTSVADDRLAEERRRHTRHTRRTSRKPPARSRTSRPRPRCASSAWDATTRGACTATRRP